jgi:HK97 family phage major capsid protein
MDNYTKALRDQIGSAWKAYTDLTDSVASESRSLSAEERGQMERIEADLDALKAEEKRHLERVAGLQTTDGIAEAIAPAVEKAVRAEPDTDLRTLQKIALGELAGADFEFEQRALGNTPDGGSALTSVFSGIFSRYERLLNPTMDVARVIETPDNVPLDIFQWTADQAYGGTVTAEGAGIVAADPTLASVTLYTYKYPSITFVSNELARTNVIGLADLIAQGAAREIGLDVGVHLTTGDGSGKPQGFFNGATNAGTASGTSVDQAGDTYFGPSDLVDLLMALAPQYRMNAVWMLSTAGVAKVRKMKDSNGNFLYNPLGEGIVRGNSGTLLGRPVYENPGVSDPGSAITTALAIGDFSAGFVVRRLPLRVDSDASFKFQNDQLSIRTIMEVDSAVIDTNAIKYLVCQAV